MVGKISHWVLLWGLFILICFGLGYPSLNRYDPRLAVSSDSVEYYKLVEGSPKDASDHYRYRVLVPYFAKPFSWLAKGRVGTWNPVFFGLLVVNSIFTATSASLLVIMGYTVLKDYGVALLGALLYLLNFNVPNTFLAAGLVDSGEACLMLATAWVMLTTRWSLLPILGVAGALAKETFVPISIVFSATWLVIASRQEGLRLTRLIWVIAMGLSGLATVTLLQSTVSGYMIWPWEVALSEKSDVSFFWGLHEPFLDHSFMYVFVWLLPLGLWHLGRLPESWVFASAAAALTAFTLGVWHESGISEGSGVPRAMFNTVGPVLSLSVASLILRMKVWL